MFQSGENIKVVLDLIRVFVFVEIILVIVIVRIYDFIVNLFKLVNESFMEFYKGDEFLIGVYYYIVFWEFVRYYYIGVGFKYVM